MLVTRRTVHRGASAPFSRTIRPNAQKPCNISLKRTLPPATVPFTRLNHGRIIPRTPSVLATRVRNPMKNMKIACKIFSPFHSFRSYSISSKSHYFINEEKDPNKDVKPVGSELIPMINSLQEIFTMVGSEIDLPQIIAIGGQSSGKSSVLESLVGRSFLPRGTGIVTRCPIILQLRHIDSQEEWGEFLHKPGIRYTNFDEIRHEIEMETNAKAGTNKAISSEPILLKIFSPNVLNLTLIDTPGIVRVPVGNQPTNIEEHLREMILEYIKNPNAIILAVTAANQDLATSDALKLARDVDPDGLRTIGVLTKLDLMDKGTDAVSILMGHTMPLRHGWIGVVNRCQQDIVSGVSVKSGLDAEKKFFREHPAYRSFAERCGTAYLAERCSSLLTEHIRRSLPKLRAQLNDLIKQKQAELEQYGDPIVPDSPTAKGYLLLQLLGQFSADFRAAIDGIPPEIETSELNGGARIRYIFSESFANALAEIKSTTGLTTGDIRTAIRNAAGPKPALFVPDRAFEQLTKRQIELLRDPALACAEQVHQELLRIVANIKTKDLIRYPRMREKIVEVATSALKKYLKETIKMIETLLQLEQWINTNHPDFLAVKILAQQQARPESMSRYEEVTEQHHTPSHHSNEGGFFSSWLWSQRKQAEQHAKQIPPRRVHEASLHYPPAVITLDDKNIPERERLQIDIVKSLVDAYFKIAKKNVQDLTMKTIMIMLVNAAKENLHKELVANLYKEEHYSDLLNEDPVITARRAAAREQLETLQKGKKIIQMSELAKLRSV